MADELLDAWVESVCLELGLPAEAAAFKQVVLDLARDAAHNVMRPAAPLTTFLVGLAAGRAAAGDTAPDLATAVTSAAATATALIEQFTQPG